MFSWSEYNEKLVMREEILRKIKQKSHEWVNGWSGRSERKGLSRKSEYTKRWLVESVFSSIKRTFNEILSSRKLYYAIRELSILLHLFNLFHSL